MWMTSDGELLKGSKRTGMLKSLLGRWRIHRKKPLLPLEADRYSDSIYEVPVSRINPLFIDNDESSDHIDFNEVVPEVPPRNGTVQNNSLNSIIPIDQQSLEETTELKNSPIYEYAEPIEDIDEVSSSLEEQQTEEVSEALNVLDRAISESGKTNPDSVSEKEESSEPAHQEEEDTSRDSTEVPSKNPVQELLSESPTTCKNPNPVGDSDLTSAGTTESSADTKETVSVVKPVEVPANKQEEGEIMPQEIKSGQSVFGSRRRVNREESSSSVNSDTSETKPLQKPNQDASTLKKVMRVRARAIEELIKKFQSPAETENTRPVPNMKSTVKREMNFPIVQPSDEAVTKSVQVPLSLPPQSTPVLTFPPPPPPPPPPLPVEEKKSDSKPSEKSEKFRRNSPPMEKPVVSQTTIDESDVETPESHAVEKTDQVPLAPIVTDTATIRSNQTENSQNRGSGTLKTVSERSSYLHSNNHETFSGTGLFAKTKSVSGNDTQEKIKSPHKPEKVTISENSNSTLSSKPSQPETTSETQGNEISTNKSNVNVDKSTPSSSKAISKLKSSKSNSTATRVHKTFSQLKSSSENTTDDNDRYLEDPTRSKDKQKATALRSSLSTAKSSRKLHDTIVKTLSEDSGVTRTDQTSTGSQTPENESKPENKIKADELKSEETDESRSKHKQRPNSSRHHSCRHHKHHKNDTSSSTKSKCDDYYEEFIRGYGRSPMWHYKRPDSWASDMPWDDFLERSYFTGLHRHSNSVRSSHRPLSGRGSYRDLYSMSNVIPEELSSRVYLNPRGRSSIRKSSSEDSLAAYGLNAPFCPCRECWLSLWRDSFVNRSSLRSRTSLSNGGVCTCGAEPNLSSSTRKVKFAEHLKKDSGQGGQLSQTEEVPETDTDLPQNDSSEKNSENETSSSTDQTSSPATSEKSRSKNVKNAKKHSKKDDSSKVPKESLKPKFYDRDMYHAHPWEIESWDNYIRQRLLKKRRRRAQFMAVMALILVIFIGLIVGIVMIYLRRKTL